MQFRGAQALVTGANRGLGSHFMEALLARGAERVYAAARRTDALADAVENHGDRVVPVQLDVTDEETVRRLADDLPDVDVVVSNAGRPCKLPVLQGQAEEEFRSAMDVNFFGPLGLVRAFAPHLVRHRGGILFVQSLAALVISRSSPIYSASKAAAMMLAAGVRAETKSWLGLLAKALGVSVGARSSTTWALVPEKPNELTPTQPSSAAIDAVGTSIGTPARSMCGLSVLK